jgi:hypothetical protein
MGKQEEGHPPGPPKGHLGGTRPKEAPVGPFTCSSAGLRPGVLTGAWGTPAQRPWFSGRGRRGRPEHSTWRLDMSAEIQVEASRVGGQGSEQPGAGRVRPAAPGPPPPAPHWTQQVTGAGLLGHWLIGSLSADLGGRGKASCRGDGGAFTFHVGVLRGLLFRL